MAEKKKDSLDSSVDEILPSMKFAHRNFRGLLWKYIKIWLSLYGAMILAMIILGLISIVPLAILAGGFSGIGQFLTANPLIGILFYAWIMVAYLILIWIQTALMYASIPITVEHIEKKYSGIWKTFSSIKLPVLGHLVVYAAFIFIFSIPLIASILLSGSPPSGAGFILGYFLLLGLILLFAFFSQFWLWELLVMKKGVLESLKRSLSIVMGNLPGVLVFDIVLVAVWGAYYIAAMIVTYASLIPLIIFAGLENFWVVIPWVILISALSTLLLSLAQLFILPYTYSFWRAARKG